jgi:hypothetical protein
VRTLTLWAPLLCLAVDAPAALRQKQEWPACIKSAPLVLDLLVS